jgi:hypothetical protein
MQDGDVELVRHFLILGAKDVGLLELAQTIERWEVLGPGVWVDVEPEVLAAHPTVFDAAVRTLEQFGDTVDIRYLNTELQRFCTAWHAPQKVARISAELNRLKQLILQGSS